MRSANIGVLKNQLSAYVKLVREGEEVIVCDRNVPVARLIPLDLNPVLDPEEARLVAAGILKLPQDPVPMDWEAFGALPRPSVSEGAAREAIEWAKGES